MRESLWCFLRISTQVKPLLSNNIWNELSTKFYVTFWSLSLYDLETPAESYKKERQKLATQAQTNMMEADFKSSADKIVKKKREQERCKLLVAKFIEVKLVNAVDQPRAHRGLFIQ